MKARDLIKVLSKYPDRDVMIALGSFRVDSIKEVRVSSYCNDLSKPNVPSLNLYPTSYKSSETKGVDYP